MARTQVVLIAIILSTMAGCTKPQATNHSTQPSEAASHPVVGGRCDYQSTAGHVVVERIESAPETENNCATDPVRVVLRFTPSDQRPIPLRFSMGRTLRVRAWLPPGSWKEQSFPLPTNKSPPVHAPLPCSNRISLPWTPAATLASPSESMTHRVVALPKYSLTLIGTLNRRTECHDLHSFSSRHGIVFPRLETRHAGSYPFLGRCRRVLAVLPRP